MLRMWIGGSIGSLILFASGCSSGPKPLQPGTPEFIWAAAKSTYSSGDFVKAKDNLAQLAKGQTEFAARSQALSIVLSAGIAQAYIDLADNFEIGARANRANPTPFHRHINLFRSQAAAASMENAEMVHQLRLATKAETVELAFGYPPGNSAEPVQFQRVAKGLILADSDVEGLQKEMMQRSVLLAMARAVGAPDDTAKALEMFKAGDVKAPRGVFLYAAAKALCDEAELFTGKKLDQPNRLGMLLKEAEEAAAGLPDNKETKELKARIAKMKKTGKIT
jgi:hypothetical protein